MKCGMVLVPKSIVGHKKWTLEVVERHSNKPLAVAGLFGSLPRRDRLQAWSQYSSHGRHSRQLRVRAAQLECSIAGSAT